MITKVTSELKVYTEEPLAFLKQNAFSRVIDIGGGMYSWASEFVTHIADIQLYDGYEDKRFFKLDFNDPSTFAELYEDITTNGPFDFVLCTHTLEDLRNPEPLLKLMPKIGKQGFIAVPNKYREMCKFAEGYHPDTQRDWELNSSYRGYMHHRWICVVIDGVFYMIPKLPILESVTWLDCATQDKMHHTSDSLSVWWEQDYEFKFCLNDFLGPNPPAVLNEMKRLLTEGT